MHTVTVKEAFTFIKKMIRPYPIPILIMFLVAIFWAVDLSLRPYILKIILDRVVDTPAKTIFHTLAIPVIFYFLLTLLLNTIFRFYDYYVTIKMIPSLRRRITYFVFSHLIQHSHRYFQNNFAGSLANKVNDLVINVPELTQIVIDRFLSIFLSLIVAIFTLWFVNYKFALLILFWSIAFTLFSLLLSERLHILSDRWSELTSSITGKIVDALSNALSIRLFARHKREILFLGETLDTSVQVEEKLQWTYFWLWVFYGASFVIMQGLCLYFLLVGRQNGSITVGDFALVLTINISIVDFLWQLAKEFSQFSRSLGKIVQALRTTTEPHEIVDSLPPKTLTVSEGKIVFDNVYFQYQHAHPLFSNLSVTIYPGQKVGLVGYSGSGKTTFTSVLLRLYDINHGIISIDNQNITTITQDSLHEAIGMIPQDPSLFHRSLLENIRYGRSDATDEEVAEAAQKAHAHDFILKQPKGYHSLVGERGVKLSGGQRQRIAIARAILKNAPILILDEATSQLDSITEALIQKSLWELMQNKTTLIIAHRLSTLLNMDRVLVFNKGIIVEDGTHEELLEKNGIYKKLWDAQVGGFLPDNA